MNGVIGITIIVLAGWLVVGVVWDRTQQRARDLDEREHQRSLMREIRRHDREAGR